MSSMYVAIPRDSSLEAYFNEAKRAGRRRSLTSTYVATPRDSSLEAYLHEVFKIVEMCFENLNQDGSDTLMFKDLQRQLSLAGFNDGKKLEDIFKRVDEDRSGCLDFAEFLAMLVLFTIEVGNIDVFFRHEVTLLPL